VRCTPENRDHAGRFWSRLTAEARNPSRRLLGRRLQPTRWVGMRLASSPAVSVGVVRTDVPAVADEEGWDAAGAAGRTVGRNSRVTRWPPRRCARTLRWPQASGPLRRRRT
jgi:hypothetical protein